MTRWTGRFFGCLWVLFFAACNADQDTLFSLLPPGKTGIHFSNRITDNDTLNILKEEYIYNGGGVGIGDFNNDSLPDVYFTGNMVDNKMYLNRGDFQFEDITDAAQVGASGTWCSGVAVVDINQDGWLDLYVGATLYKDSTRRKNLLYLNQGLNEQKIPTFKEVAAEYGLDDTGNTTHAAFFDYDKDGDLDLYVLTNVINKKVPSVYRKKITNGTALNNDRLYRNDGIGPDGHSQDGHPIFTNVTKEAGIVFEGFGLGLAITDINLDGWPDVYITNDYLSNDLLYINNQDGTFTNRASDYLCHTAYSAMGNDVVDINNDGLVDIVALDMMPENNKRQKMMISANNYMTYINNEQYGFDYQYVRNVLQLNNGITPEGHPTFSEIGQLAGIHQTDWSWTPLVADFDNDGYRDIIITNGFPRDVTDHDFGAYRTGPAGAVTNIMDMLKLIPEVKIPNYAYKNEGNLTFTDKTKEWGLNIPSFSNGAAYADLDNDGDLDFVVNNIDDSAFVYQNHLLDKPGKNHYLRVKLKGTSQNEEGLGTKISIHYGQGKQQYYEHTLYRGYLSTVENVAHFGIGEETKIDSIEVFWPDGRYQLLKDVPADQEITLRWTEADQMVTPSEFNRELQFTEGKTLFREVSAEYGVHYKHQERDKIDFNVQRTLPHKYTQYGPGIATGDVNGDGWEDFFLGGAANRPGTFFMQSQSGTFWQDTSSIKTNAKLEEDMGVLLFDADGDGDLDLYAVSGSYEFEPGSELYQDRLYKNDGKGHFVLDAKALPQIRASGSCVKAADYDQDGDLDLFVGGRVVPGQYPMPPQSYLLRNDGGKFMDVTKEVCPELTSLGMITDALWSDFDNDGHTDLVIAGEWLPVSFFKNSQGTFRNVTEATGVADQVGWWNSLVSGDFDNDGDTDYMVGNLGLNTRYKSDKDHPLTVYAKDFDGNGSVDPILVGYMKDEHGELQPFPMHTRDDLISQMVRIKQQFPNYAQFSEATIHEILSEEDLKGAVIYQANHMASSYLENQGGGKFRLTNLPALAQLAPVYGMLSQDFDGDGYLDVLMVGNDYGTEVFTGRYDAMVGLYLKGNGQGEFQPAHVQRSGFFVKGDAKGMASLYDVNDQELILVSQNQDSLRMFTNSDKMLKSSQVISLQPMDAWAELQLKSGKTRKEEFYYGSTYLSQSARKLKAGSGITAITIYNFAGKKREIKLAPEKKLVAK